MTNCQKNLNLLSKDTESTGKNTTIRSSDKQMKKYEKSIDFGGKKLTIATGHIAQQADGAVLVTYGETVVLSTVVAAPLRQEMDYFPLSVEYEEKLFAGGRIKGSRWVKRDGRPSDEAILVARLIDRSIRPLFPEEYIKDVQIINTVLSVDLENSPDMVAAIATVAALQISPIPFAGPIATVRVGRNDDKFILNPVVSELEKSDMDLIVSSTDKAVVMIEMGGDQISEDDTVKAIDFAQKESKKLLEFLTTFAKGIKVEKQKVEKHEIDKGIYAKVKKALEGKVMDLAGKMATKELGYSDYDALKASVLEGFEVSEKSDASKAFEKIFKMTIWEGLLVGKRPDGRKSDELRSLAAEVSILPRTHGSGLFRRGQTQALTVTTIGSTSLELLLETPQGESSKGYIHHYSMPPYSTGETGRVGTPKRREIGHGALAERALIPVLPEKDDFPYMIHVVTEILSSNGSTSMASVCGSTLSLMDAGVPIKAPVAGIAMGIVMESEKKNTVLTDIVGIEDGNGDMDFKVAGTKDGITALQLDVKSLLLTTPLLKKALEQGKKARLEILAVMTKAIDAPRPKVSQYAPKIKVIHIDVDKIGELIGPGGKTIKSISAQTDSHINVEDDGSVSISAETEEALEGALRTVENITKEVKPGEIYDGVVKRLQNFGAFVEILPGKEGLVHVSDMSQDFVKDPADVLEEGQEVKVRVKEVDDFKRINLSMLLDGDKPKREERKPSGFSRGGGNSGGDSRNDRGGRSGGFGGGARRQSGGYRGSRNNSRDAAGGNQSKGGPHFPTSRLMDLDKGEFNR